MNSILTCMYMTLCTAYLLHELLGGWYVEDNSNSETSIITLKNDNITKFTPLTFTLTVSSSTNGLAIYNYSVIDARATDDFILSSTEIGKHRVIFYLS